jgi:hypothetical protein
VDHNTATEVIATMDASVAAGRPFFIGVGMIRPHLPFIVPEDVWAQYNDSTIKLPGSLLPPVNAANISLNDQIFQGTHKFCPTGSDPAVDCPSAERSQLPTDSNISPFKPFDATNIRFLRHGCEPPPPSRGTVDSRSVNVRTACAQTMRQSRLWTSKWAA